MTGPETGAPKQNVTEEDAKSAAARVVASVLDLPGIAGVAEPILEPLGKALLALTEPVDAIESLAGSARRMLGVVVTQSAREEPSVRETLEGESGPSGAPEAPRSDPTPPPWPQLISDLVEELVEHAAATDAELRREARAALRELGTEMTGLAAMAAVGPGGKLPKEIVSRVVSEIAKRAGKLKKVLNRLEKIFGKITAPRFRLALKLLEAEVVGSAPDRAVIAALLAVPGFLADLAFEVGSGAKESKSTRNTGTEVHEFLQREYRSLWASPKLVGKGASPFVRGAVVQDGIAYFKSMSGTPLARAARSEADGSLYALLFARLPERAIGQVIGNKTMDQVWSMYREDVLDMRCGEVWEIKPMRSAAIGVYQEMQYRHSFNLVNALMLDIRDLFAAGSVSGLLGKRMKFYKGLKGFSREVPLIPGLDANWVPIKRAFVVGRSEGRPRLAVPMTVPQLPGLLLYVLLELPAAALLVLSGVLAKAIADQLEKLARDYAKFVEEVLEALARVALAALAALAMGVVVLLFWESLAVGGAMEGLAALARLLARFAPALSAGAALAPGLTSAEPEAGAPSGQGSLPRALMEVARQAKLKVLAPPRVVGDEVVVQLAPVEQGSGPHVPVIDVALGNVRVCGLPASARPIVDALAQMGAAIAAGVFAEFLGEKKGQA